tara:strand:+ start:10307 stop:10528 length:222 start_codon:yes stop_codon:yes gene_type:complete
MCLDAGMVRWIPKLGPHYQARMNAVLRMYYHGMLSGEIEIAEAVHQDHKAVDKEERKFEIYRQEMRAKMRRID